MKINSYQFKKFLHAGLFTPSQSNHGWKPVEEWRTPSKGLHKARGWKVMVTGLILFASLSTYGTAQATVPVIDSSNLSVNTKTAGNTAVTAGNTGSLVKKEYVLDSIMRGVARQFLRSLLDQIVNWIKTGGKDGSPLFIQDGEKFLTQAADEAGAQFLNELLGMNICSQFKTSIPRIIGQRNALSFRQRYSCTISGAIRNLEGFYNNFEGGWDAWLTIAQPQNHYEGALLLALYENDRRIEQKVQARSQEAIAGAGFIGVKNCKGGFSDPDGNFICTQEEIVTPGRIIHDTLEKTTNTDIDWLITADELEEVIFGIGEALVKRLIDSSSGPNPTGFTGNLGSGGAPGGEIETGLARAKRIALQSVNEYISVESQIETTKQQTIDTNTLTLAELNRWKETEQRILTLAKALPEDKTAANTNITSINQQVTLIHGLQASTTQQLADIRSRKRTLNQIKESMELAGTIEEVNRQLDSANLLSDIITSDRLKLIQGLPQQELSDANSRLQQARSGLTGAQQRENAILSRPDPENDNNNDGGNFIPTGGSESFSVGS